MKKQTDYAQVGLAGVMLCILFMVLSNIMTAQSKVSFVLVQDLKLATIGDPDRGYNNFTPNIVARFKMQGIENKHGYLTVFPEFEYARIDGDYFRYSANAGYSFNKIFKDWHYTPAIGWGWIDRYDKAFFSWGFSLECAYSLSDTFSLVAVGQLTERKDLLWLWGDNAVRFSGFIGIEIKL